MSENIYIKSVTIKEASEYDVILSNNSKLMNVTNLVFDKNFNHHAILKLEIEFPQTGFLRLATVPFFQEGRTGCY